MRDSKVLEHLQCRKCNNTLTLYNIVSKENMDKKIDVSVLVDFAISILI